MHISLDAALQRQPLLSTVGDKLLPAFPGAAAAYSLRALNGDANNVVNVRRDADDEERDFTAEGVALELENWVNGKLETTLPADVDTAAAAYSLRKVRTDYPGNAVQIRRASDDVEVNVAFDSNGKVSTSSAITNVVESPDAGDTTATTLGEFLTEEIIAYESDFSAGVDGWSDNNGNATVTGNQDGVGGRDDVLKIENTAGVARQVRPQNNTAIPHDGTFRLTLDVYRVGGTGVPAYIGAYSGNAGATQNPSVSTEMTEDQWVTIDFGNLTYENYTRFNLFFSASPDSTTVSGVADGGTIYFRNAKVTTVANEATVVTWYDQSVNGYDLTQPTTGNQPKIAENGSLLTLAGKPTIKPDGSDDFLINENAAWNTINNPELSCMTVAEGTSLTNKLLWAIGSSSSEDTDWLIGGSSVSGNVQFRGNRINSGATFAGTSGAFLLTGLDVTGGDGYINGVASGSPVSVSRDVTADRLVLFTRRGSSSLGTCTDQSISEIIFYSSDQSDNRFKIESNINNHYGIYTPAEDGFVETWYDQSGNGNDAVQPTTGGQPKIVSAGSYLGALNVDGVDSELKTGSISGLIDNVSHSIFAVAKYNAVTSSFEAFVSAGYGTTGTKIASVIGGDGSGRIWFGGDDQLGPTGGSITTNTLYLLTKTYDGATISGHVDGGAANTASAVFNVDGDENVIAIGGYGPAATARINGQVSEAIIYLSDQSANRTAIESNIADEYGITLS